MTNQQINQAIKIHDQGLSWSIVSASFKVSTNKLRKQIIITMNQLIEQYSALLQKAEQTTSRNEAIKMIRESTKVREQMAEYSRLR